MPPQLLRGDFDETIPMMMITQYRKPAFKKLFILVKSFQVTPLARGTSPAGSTTSSVHLGVSAADYSQQSRAQGGFNVHTMEQGDGQARLSHGGWPALPTAPVTPGVKCAASSKLLKKVEAKMAHQMQQAGHLMLVHIYLPSALVGGTKLYQMSKKSLESLSQEWERLGRETRAAQVLYASMGLLGQQQMVLMQPTQASGIAELPAL